MYDVIIAGGGPAGLNAALVLSRCLRKVVVLDSGKPRNQKAQAMHGFITRDGISPQEFIAIGRNEVIKYGAEFREAEIIAAHKKESYFEVTTANNEVVQGKKLLVATGIKDFLPELEGVDQLYGKGVHHCPYCDGWEVRNQPLIAYGLGKEAIGLSLSLKTWSQDVTLCTDGTKKIPAKDLQTLESNSIKINTAPIARLQGDPDGWLEFIIFKDKSVIPAKALFFSMGTYQHSDLLQQLGCTLSSKGVAKTNHKQQTNIPGLFVAGDAGRDMQQVIIAAAEGAKAGIMINTELQKEERQ